MSKAGKSLRWGLAPAVGTRYNRLGASVATSPWNKSNAKGRNTMNPEQVQQRGTQETADVANRAIDESGKVDRIRDILFGSQMRDYDSRFQRLEERLTRDAADTRADIQKRL